MRTTAALLAISGSLSVALAQPLDQNAREPDTPPAQLDDPREDAREINFERLRRRVSEARQRADRLDQALERLEGGAPLREALEDLRPDERRYFLPWGAAQTRTPDSPPGRVFGRRQGAADESERRGPPPEGMGPEGMGPGEGGADAAPVSPEQVRAFITKHLPEMSQHLTMIERGNPEAGQRMLGRLSPRIAEVIHAQRRDSVLGELKLEELTRGLSTIRIAREAREASRGQTPDAERVTNTRQRLRDNLLAQAEIRAKIQRREIELLEMRIDTLRTELAERESERDEVIDEMVDQMMRRMVRGDRPRRGDQAEAPDPD